MLPFDRFTAAAEEEEEDDDDEVARLKQKIFQTAATRASRFESQ